jgi:hypothetical protein
LDRPYNLGAVFGILVVSMGKQKKKRNKVYTGQGASVSKPTVTRLSAADRNKVQQWWHDKKRVAKPVIIAALVVIVVVWLVIELVRIVLGSGT